MSYVPFREDPRFDELDNLKLAQSIASVFDLLPAPFWVAFSRDIQYSPALAIVTFAALEHIEIKTKDTRELMLDLYEEMLKELFEKTGLTPGDLMKKKRFDPSRN